MPLNVSIHIDFNAELPVEQFDMVQQIITAVQNAGANVGVTVNAVERVAPPPIPRGRRKANGAAITTQEAKAPEDVMGDTATQDEGEDDPLALPAAQGLSPEEAHGLAMGYSRHLHNAGHKGPIAQMRKHFGISKFHEIPMSRAHEFLKMAEAEGNKVGIHL